MTCFALSEWLWPFRFNTKLYLHINIILLYPSYEIDPPWIRDFTAELVKAKCKHILALMPNLSHQPEG